MKIGFTTLTNKNISREVRDYWNGGIIISKTILNPMMTTNGHSHEETNEIYVFTQGNGEIQIGDKKYKYSAGDVFTIPRGVFHRVFSKNYFKRSIFICMFKPYGERTGDDNEGS